MSEIIYFELNNWFAERDYPNEEPFLTWMDDDNVYDDSFMTSEDWAKENGICVIAHPVDMSINLCITATKEWIEKNCPNLLTKYAQFLRYPDECGDVYGRFGAKFLKYHEDNFGVTWI